MSRQLWDVVGGGDKGGILVRTGKDVSSPPAPERLCTGALIREVALDEERLHYELLDGAGPPSGWVSVSLKDGRALVVKSERQAPSPKLWRVVGGGDKGGILVRAGKDTSAPAEAERLATGSLVRELERDGLRLHFERVSGSGPARGWASTRLEGGKELLVPAGGEEGPRLAPEPLPAAPAEAGREVVPGAPAPTGLPLELAKTLGPYVAGEVGDITANHPGAHFGEVFPHTPEQLKEFGADWLTRVFRLAGSVPEDNGVARVLSQHEFLGGGAAVKVVLEVEYLRPSADLHTQLFVKMPLPPDHKNRALNIQLAFEGREVLFNRFYTKCLPFRTARFYYGDISMSTTNWILITERIAFAGEARRGERLGPDEVEPPVRKGLDFLLPDALEKYAALYRRAAMLTAWAHAGRLGPQLAELFPPAARAGYMIGFPVAARTVEEELWPRVEDFVLRHARRLFPADVAEPGYLARLRAECAEVGPLLGKASKYCTAGEELWAFVHPNLHIDNAFFLRNAAGRQDCGLLDWAGVGFSFLLSQFVSGGGALSLAGAEVRVPYTDALVACYFETLAEFGGPKLDVRDMQLRVALMDMAYIVGSMRLLETGRSGDVYEYLPKEAYDGVRGLDDPVFTADTIEALMLRSVVMMLVEGIKTWKGRCYHQIFSEWRASSKPR
uniref:Uncharacterized protein n=1 Tax=Alexandrium monilatum TaxID=311494 RepID=A0A7S4RGI6_9DINO|mmetsp:Transcript_98949/g.308600  ORF Transcript_98949/g.308600 Transcript_98949/m.308600 type:complete len:671 (-) Transcript_98949:29-2041(-)